MTSIKRIIGEGVFWYSGSTIILRLLGLATIFIVLNKLSVYEYGLIKLALSIVPLFGFLMLPGINNVVIADMGVEKGKKDFGRMKAILHNFFKIQLLLALTAWAIVFFGADLIAQFYKGEISYFLKIVSVLFLFSPFRAMLTTVFAVYFKFFQSSIFAFLQEVFKFILIIFLIVIYPTDASGVIWAQVIGEFVAMFFMIPVFFGIYRSFSKEKNTERLPFLYLLKEHGKWGMFATYLSSFGRNIRLWFIKFIIGTEAVGLYTVAAGFFSNTKALMPLSSVVAPIIPQYISQKEKFLKLINKSIKYQLLGYILLGVLMFFVFPSVVKVLFPHYLSSVPLFQIMLIALIPSAFSAIFNPVYFAFKEQKNLFFAMVFGTGMILVAAPIFLYFFGIVGIAYEFVVTTLILVFERYRALRKIFPEFRLSLKDFVMIDAEDKMLVSRIMVLLKVRK